MSSASQSLNFSSSSSFHDNTTQLHSNLSAEADTVFAVGTSIIVALSIIINGVAIILFYRKRKNLSSVERVLLHLFIQICVNSCRNILAIMSAVKHQWVLNSLSCHLYATTSNFFSMAHAMSLTSIAVIRYLKVCTSLDPHRSATADNHQNESKLPVGCYAAIYLVPGILSALPWTKLIGRYGPAPFGFYCSLLWYEDDYGSLALAFFIYLFTGVLPFIVVVFAYIRVLIKARQARNVAGSRGVQRKRYITKIVGLIIFAYLFAWTAVGVDICHKVITGKVFFDTPLQPVPGMMGKLSHITTPLIYVLLNKRYRKELVNMLRRNHESGHDSRITSVSYKVDPHQQRTEL